MADETIASGTTFTLTTPLTGGANIDFLNTGTPGGTLVIDSAAFTEKVTVNSGVTSITSVTIGGDINNFAPGDQIILANLSTLYTSLDVAPNAAAENTTFANDMKFSAQSRVQYYVENDGTVKASVNEPITNLDANSQTILDDIVAGMFGTAADAATITIAPFLTTSGGLTVTDALITSNILINPCFTAGTRILTTAGETPVEALKIGDHVVNAAGEEKKIVWIGRRALDLARHPQPGLIRPVIVEADAIAPAVPSRRLVLSPDHALFLDNMLVPVKYLINFRTIRPDSAARHVVYYHVELPAHDIMFAEGTAVESYLDTGHKGVFDNAESPLTLHPDRMQQRREAAGCAPLCTGGPALAAIRETIARRHTARARFG
jgi:hypothetical protein